jgi:hypothetical protein
VDTDDLASAEVAEEVEREETEEKVRSGEEEEEMAGVAGMSGEGDEARTGGGRASASTVDSAMLQRVFVRALECWNVCRG